MLDHPTMEPLYWVTFALVLVLGVSSYFLKRVVHALDRVEEEVQKLKIQVAVIIERDRRHRLSDYEAER